MATCHLNWSTSFILIFTLGCASTGPKRRLPKHHKKFQATYEDRKHIQKRKTSIPFIDGEQTTKITFGTERARRMAHGALFDTYFPRLQFSNNPSLVNYGELLKRQMWRKIRVNRKAKAIFTLLGNLDLLRTKLLSSVLYSFLTEQEKEGTELSRKQVAPFLYFLEAKKDNDVSLSFWNIRPIERARFIRLLMISDSRILNDVGTFLHQLYTSYIYGGPMGRLMTGIPYEYPYKELKDHKFKSHLRYSTEKNKLTGKLDVIIVGLNAASAVIARSLYRAGRKVLVIDENPLFTQTEYSEFNEKRFLDPTKRITDVGHNFIIPYKGKVGSWPLWGKDAAIGLSDPRIELSISKWTKDKLTPKELWRTEKLESIDEYLWEDFFPRKIEFSEYSSSSEAIVSEAKDEGFKVRTVETLNGEYNKAFPFGKRRQGLIQKFLLEGMLDYKNPLSYLPNTKVEKVLMRGGKDYKMARGVTFVQKSFFSHKYAVNDPIRLNIPPKVKVDALAEMVILSSGTFDNTIILKKSGVKNRFLGKNLSLDIFVPIMAEYDKNFWDFGLEELSFYLDDHSQDLIQFFYSPKTTLIPVPVHPEIVAQMSPGTPYHMFKSAMNFHNKSIYGTYIKDAIQSNAFIDIDKNGREFLSYDFTESTKKKIKEDLKLLSKMYFESGAKKIYFPSFKGAKKKEKGPTSSGINVFKSYEEAQSFIEKLQFNPYEAMVLVPQISGGLILGVNPVESVVSPRYQVWGHRRLFVVDESILNSSLGPFPLLPLAGMAKVFLGNMTR